MARGQFHTNGRLWVIVAGCIFVALGFIDPVAGVAKGDNSLWAYVRRLLTGDYYCETADILVPIAFRAVLQLVPAAVLGWVLQAIGVVILRASPAPPGGTPLTMGNENRP